jgi:hypothetical protein
MTTALIAEDELGVEFARLKAMCGVIADLPLHLNQVAGAVAEIDLSPRAA